MANIKRVLVGTLVAASGCTGNQSGNTNQTCSALTTTQAQAPAAFKGSVFTVVMENHSRDEILGSGAAPYINSLAKTNAVANGYHDSYVHPSEPNYFWMVAGENFGVLDDSDPASHHLESTSHIADQLELADLTWKAYQEGMGAPCGLVSHGRYAAKHDPFVYFNDINGWDGKQFNLDPRCTEHVVDYSQLDADIAANALPKYAFITPNLDNDMHDGSIQLGDTWLKNQLPKIMATPAYQDGGVIFLLWDEGSSGTFGGAGDDPPFLAISPMAKQGYVSNTSYDTSSYLKTVEKILGVDQVPCAKDPAAVASMDDLFTASVNP
jgi:acid phosphatase